MSGTPEFSASLAARDLAVSRNGRILVEGVDLTLSPGEAVLLRGPNGAGKTTLLRALAGLLAPAAGAVTVTAKEPGPREGARIFVGAHNGLKAALTIAETLNFWTALYRTPGERAEAAMARLGLGDYRTRHAGELSTGFARRLGLARLIVAQRPFWLIDEPTSGLDRLSMAVFEALLADHRKAGGAAVIATHDRLDAPGAAVFEIGR